MERSGFMTGGGRVLLNTIPVGFALLGVVLANLPVSLLGGLLPAPLLSLMPIYFWCLVRPDLMSPAWAFLIGVLEDVLSGGPPGVWAASFVLTYALVDRQRDAFAGLSGFGAILGFGTAALAACTTAYGIVSLFDWHLLTISPIASKLAMTVLFYGPIAVVMGGMQRKLVGPLRSDF